MAFPVGVAYVTARITSRHERKKLVDEIRRETYFITLEHITQLLDDPTLIYDDKYFAKLKNLALRMEVYAEPTLQKDFASWFDEIIKKYNTYISNFKTEYYLEEREMAGKQFQRSFDKAEEDFQIYNLPDIEQIASTAEQLKNSIVEILRKS